MRRLPSADLLRRTFAVDVLVCPTCSGAMRIIAFVDDEAVAKRILLHLGLPARAPPRGPPRRPPKPIAVDESDPPFLLD